MKHTTEKYSVDCGCRSVGSCQHNNYAWKLALDACVDEFALEMKVKLTVCFLKGKTGWDDPEWSRADILSQLRQHINKNDMVDVANFAMFAWNKEEPK